MKYEIPHSKMIPNIPKYDGTTVPDENINTYECRMTLLWMEKRFMCTYSRVTLSANVAKWFKTLRPGSIASFEQLRYLFLNNFMQIWKEEGDAKSIMACKKKEGESIRVYYDRFTLETLNVLGHE